MEWAAIEITYVWNIANNPNYENKHNMDKKHPMIPSLVVTYLAQICYMYESLILIVQ